MPTSSRQVAPTTRVPAKSPSAQSFISSHTTVQPGAVIHRAPAEKVGVGHFGDGVCEDGAVALLDPQRPDLAGGGAGHVDVEVLRAAHGAGLLGGHEVAGLRADHAGYPVPADPHLTADHQVFGHAAELVEGEKAVLVDVFDAEADLVRVGGDQDGGAGRLPRLTAVRLPSVLTFTSSA